jgi:hypothetical protein
VATVAGDVWTLVECLDGHGQSLAVFVQTLAVFVQSLAANGKCLAANGKCLAANGKCLAADGKCLATIVQCWTSSKKPITVKGTIVLRWGYDYISAANGVTACGNILERCLGSWLGFKTSRQVVAQILGEQ